MENKICGICGKALEDAAPVGEPDGVFDGWHDVPLKDGMVCKDCAEKVRILYPLRFVKTFVESGSRFGYTDVRGKSIPGRGWINALVDPLEQLTLEEFRHAEQDAQQAATAVASRYPGARAAAEVDFTYRHYVKARGSELKPVYSDQKEYVTCVKVMFGDIRAGDVVSVSHKDREYSAEVASVWFWNYLDTAQREVDQAFAGMTAALWFREELPIYPGDVLTVKES